MHELAGRASQAVAESSPIHEYRLPEVSPIVYGLGSSSGVFPTDDHARDIVDGLRENWTYMDRGQERVAYAHPERLDPSAWTSAEGSVGAHLASGRMRLVALQDDDGRVLASALLIKNQAMGNVEIGSVQSRIQDRVRGLGRSLMKQVFIETRNEPIVFLDTAKVRTPMEGSPRYVAMPHPDDEGYHPEDARIVAPTYIIGNQFGDKVTRWSSNGDFAFSVSRIRENGPFRVPRLNRSNIIHDGTEEILGKVAQLANAEGRRHEITVFGERTAVSESEPFEPYSITPETTMVDYRDVETRQMVAGFGQKPTGVEFGVGENGDLIVGIHYSAMVPPEVSYGIKKDLTPGYHPIHTTIPSTGELANFVRESMQK